MDSYKEESLYGKGLNKTTTEVNLHECAEQISGIVSHFSVIINHMPENVIIRNSSVQLQSKICFFYT